MAEIKRLSLATDVDGIFELSQFAFQYSLTEADLNKKKEEAERHIIWGWMEDDQLAAKLHLIPLACYINGKVFEMGGVSSVATWPEFRRQGAVKQLLHHSLQYMRQHGQTLSFLHPFSFAFYRKYGWEHTFSEKAYTTPIAQLKRQWEAYGYVRRIEDDIEVLQAVYTAYAKKFNGMLARDEKWWKQRVLKGDWHKAAAYNSDGKAEGYLLYKVKEGKLSVQELVYTSLNAQKLLLQFIANHDSMAETVDMVVPENDNLSLIVGEPRFEQKINPYFMARIVDVFTFLKEYPFHNGTVESVILHVDDAFLPENNGVYQLSQIGSDTNVTHLQSNVGQAAGIYCGVQQLTSIMMGYKRPTEMYHAGLIHGKPEQIERLEQIIPRRQTYFPDFF
ncbi:enhanced intracellular survival protein Eis [Lentibacillus sp. CBA3610]|uniref:GNAT family N-acetyltransferase n=1 Tax=Lentibacillus sp. CBA3610 TaxID=2518176 RepID=UPI001595B3C0|nr:GNAT family N-acetyltransferase [Lentibacillus sp. CBA3610]QKY70983.1 GNAT family N-acetyltransferase [Lentibacillus sp. CBA3610]